MAWTQVAGKANGACDIDAAGSAEAEPFLAQEVEDDGQRFGVGDLVGLVDLGPVEIGGDASLADPLGDGAAFGLEHAVLVEIVERGAHGIGAVSYTHLTLPTIYSV